MDKEQVYMYNREEVKYHFDVEGNEDLVVVLDSDGYGEYKIARKTDLVKKEDSYEHKRARERARELEQITENAKKNLKKMSDKLVDEAIKTLSSRIKFNVAFGEGGAHGAYALMLSESLTKLIKEEAPKAIEKKDPF